MTVTSDRRSLEIERVFTTPGVHPYDQVNWVSRDVVMKNWRDGTVNFEQYGVEFPATWSENAANIVTTKYFRGAVGTPERETGLRQVIDRIVGRYVSAFLEFGYGTAEQAEILEHELTYMLLHQIFSFNSPVWFNVGTAAPQQVSACFILAVDDSMDSILDWYKEEGRIFKGGSGAGVSLSRIRSSKELLRSGGTASGPVSFMRGADASAGTIKSGGATRRAAKMVVLDVDHPDIEEFIETKVREEDKIRALRDAGFDMDLGGKDIVSVQYQNANNSVRVNDEFMRAVEAGTGFGLRARRDGAILETVDARKLWRQIAEAAWACADPGVQYDGAIQDWHTTPNSGRISASNPCFTGDTLVAVADGRNAVRIDELVGMEVDVYSKDSRGRTVIRKMKDIRRTRRDAQIVTVALDDGTMVRCTPDHLFMLRDGSYVPANELQPGVALRRFDSEVAPYGGAEHGARRRRVTGARGWTWQHHAIGERNYGQYRDRLGTYHLDHIDGDTLNDAPGNLQVITAAEHATKTVAENMAGDANPARRLMNDTWKANIAAAVRGARNPRFIEADRRALAETYRDAVIDDVPTPGRPRKEHVAWNAYVRRNGLVGQVPLARGDGRIQGMAWEEFVASIREVGVNHEVVSVVPSGVADVFDGEVEETHNFAIITTSGADPRTDTLSGVFVHNCSEYMSLDNSSCNLASMNLLKFLQPDGTFDADTFAAAVKLVFTAMDVSISFADFPTEKIGETTRAYRQLGIGYANLGALLMATGHAYDSDGGRDLAAAITSLMSAAAYERSAELAATVGPYDGYAANDTAHLRVLRKHRDASAELPLHPLSVVATAVWDRAHDLAYQAGLRNAQVSLLAPTGTIGLAMDCDTTGIEPGFSLVQHKKLVGGGSMAIANQSVGRALRALDYAPEAQDAILAYVAEHGHVVGAPGLAAEHYEVFDCAVGQRAISPLGHLRMMAAVQPFLSGAISKTVNVPAESTVEDIADTYMQGWKLGLKAVAIYRDGSKVGQPLSEKKKDAEPEVKVVEVHKPKRTRLPKKRRGQTVSFTVAGAQGYMTVGEYDDGTPGEVFIKMSKQGSTLAGVMDSLSVALSIGLQYGVPLEAFAAKYINMRFEPAGLTDDEDVRIAQSIVDYLFRRLAIDYLDADARAELGIATTAERTAAVENYNLPAEAMAQDVVVEAPKPVAHDDAPLCMTCGIKMQRAGSCHLCPSCGSTSGCS